MKYSSIRVLKVVTCVLSIAVPSTTFALVNSNTVLNTDVGINVTTDSQASTSNTSSGISVSGVINVGDVSSDTGVQAYSQSISDSDSNVSDVSTNDTHVSVSYKEPAKFLGFISTHISVTAESDSSGKVKIKHPWYAFLMKTQNESSLQADAQVRAQSVTSAQAGATMSAQTKAALVQALYAALRSHVTASASADASTGY